MRPRTPQRPWQVGELVCLPRLINHRRYGTIARFSDCRQYARVCVVYGRRAVFHWLCCADLARGRKRASAGEGGR